MTNKEKVLQFLKDYPDGYCDDCLSQLVNAYPRQQVNQICNQLHKGGFIYRSKSSCFKCSKCKFVNCYVLSGVAPDVPLEEIFRGILIFIIPLMLLAVTLLFVPEIALFLLGTM